MAMLDHPEGELAVGSSGMGYSVVGAQSVRIRSLLGPRKWDCRRARNQTENGV